METKADAPALPLRSLAAGLVVLFLGSLLIRLWPLWAIEQSWEDAYYYLELARSLAQGRFQLLGEFHTKYLPGYPGAILVVHTALLGLADWFSSAQLVCLISSAAAAGLCFVLASDLTGDRRAGWAAGLMAMFNGHLVTWSGMPFSEALFAGQVMLVLALLGRAPLAAGAVAGWAAITRHQGWFLAASILLFLVQEKDRRRPALALLVMLAVASAWWVLAYLKTGHWLFEIYTQEAAERGPVMGQPGIRFLLLSFPVAGHLVTIFALPGAAVMAARPRGRPALAFLLPYFALHCWWMFGVERYFVPLVPLVCVMAGCGLRAGERWLTRLRGRPQPGEAAGSRWPGLVVPGLGLLAGWLHFAGFAPAMVEEEAVRTQGYLQAVRYVRNLPGDFSVMAYDAFLVGFHDGRHPVIPSGMIGSRDWERTLPGLFVHEKLRAIIWSDLYPADRAKPLLSGPEEFEAWGEVETRGGRLEMGVLVRSRSEFQWTYSYPAPGWIRPWRRMVQEQKTARVWLLDRAP